MVAGAEAGLGETPIKNSTMKNFLDALVAVLAGNAIYYLLMPHLPTVARHTLFKEDLGPAGGFRDLHGDLCRGEVCAAGRMMIGRDEPSLVST